MVQLSGSVVEGATMARCFQKKADWKEVELDVMYNFVTLSQEVSHLLQTVPDKPGFVRLPYRELYATYFHPAVAAFHKHKRTMRFSEAPFISPLIVKDNVRHLLRYKDERDYAKHFINLVMGAFNIKGNHSESETTIEVTVNIEVKDGSLNIFIDHVPSVRLLFWPHQATAWITRPRLWPPQVTVQRIVDEGCQLVPRSSPGGDVNSEWRLSFSDSEATLAQLRSQEQQEAYYLLKILFYRYLKSVESSEPERKALFSYTVKTIMMWACEDLPPGDPIWASLESSVQMLLFMLLSSLEAGYLRHYFIPEINLLERVGEDVRSRCAAIVSSLPSSILMASPFDMPEKQEFVKYLVDHCSLANTIRSCLSTKRESEKAIDILKRLFPKKE